MSLQAISRRSTTDASPVQSGRARQPHAVVIGAGIGGLAAAVRLGARGYRVTVLERLDAPGGRAYVFRQDGFTFDAGPTIITAPFLLEELWALAGRRLADDVRLQALDPFYRIRFDDGSTLDCSGDPAAMRARVARLSPADVAGYERFMREAEDVYRVGFEELGDTPFDSWVDMARILPSMVRLRSDRSVHAFAARHVKDERLRIALSFHPLFVGGNPFRVTSIYGLIAWLERRWGVHFVHGGTGRLVQGLVGLIEGQGGAVRCGADVAQILLTGRRACGVRLTDGEQIAADVVVSNADSAWTYRHLLPATARRRWTDARIDRSRFSMGLFVWYFGTRRRYPDVPHHTILLGPRYRGLLDDIFERKVLSDDFSLYLHRPTASDPSLAPPGADAFYVLSPVPHLDAGVDWRTAAEPYRQRLAAFLERTLLPGLGAEVVTSRTMTPLDFHDRLLAYKGAAFGLEPTLRQSAWFRPHNRSEDIDRLYLVGAGTHPGAGVPGVLSSARVLDKVVPHARELA
jgi:phytoene desaturase